MAAIADEGGVTCFTVKRWEIGVQYPDTPKPVNLMLATLLNRLRVPKKRYDFSQKHRTDEPVASEAVSGSKR